MLSRDEARKAVEALFGRIYDDSPFGTLGRFAAWLSMSYGLLRQWESRGVPDTVLARMLAEACSLPLSEWLALGESRERLHEEDGTLNPVWAVGLLEDIELNPSRVRAWADDETADAEERLAVILCLSRQKKWQRRYWYLLVKPRDERVTEEYAAFLKGLVKRRAELGYTQEDIVRLIGASGSSIASWETGHRGYNWHTRRPTTRVLLYAAFLKLLEPKENR